jgi:cell division protein FtsI (penicillin-binding protein 3)
MVDEPRPYYYGGVVAAPVFKRVASEALRYLGVMPKAEAVQEVTKSKNTKVAARKKRN